MNKYTSCQSKFARTTSAPAFPGKKARFSTADAKQNARRNVAHIKRSVLSREVLTLMRPQWNSNSNYYNRDKVNTGRKS